MYRPTAPFTTQDSPRKKRRRKNTKIISLCSGSGGSLNGRSESDSPSPPSSPPLRLARLINDVSAHFQAPLRRSALAALDNQVIVFYQHDHGVEGPGQSGNFSELDTDDYTVFDESVGESTLHPAHETDVTVYEDVTDAHMDDDMSSPDEILDTGPIPLGIPHIDFMNSSMEVELSLSGLGEWSGSTESLDLDLVEALLPSVNTDSHLQLTQFVETFSFPDILVVEDVYDASSEGSEDDYEYGDYHDYYYRLYVQLYYRHYRHYRHHDSDSDSDRDAYGHQH